MGIKPIRFIDEPVSVSYKQEPLLEKKPGCPDEFIWHGEVYKVMEMLQEWHDYSRRGRAARNMQPQHAEIAMVKGSWGVGRDYYRVQTDRGKMFTLYYDRAPKDALTKSSGWFLLEELEGHD